MPAFRSPTRQGWRAMPACRRWAWIRRAACAAHGLWRCRRGRSGEHGAPCAGAAGRGLPGDRRRWPQCGGPCDLAGTGARALGRLRAIGFTGEMEKLMAAADLVVTKPGGLTISRCLALGRPMLLASPIPGREEHNAGYTMEEGAPGWPTTPSGSSTRSRAWRCRQGRCRPAARSRRARPAPGGRDVLDRVLSRGTGRLADERPPEPRRLATHGDVLRLGRAHGLLCQRGDPDRRQRRLGQFAAHLAHREALGTRHLLGWSGHDYGYHAWVFSFMALAFFAPLAFSGRWRWSDVALALGGVLGLLGGRGLSRGSSSTRPTAWPVSTPCMCPGIRAG